MAERRMPILDASGTDWVQVDNAEASVLGNYWNAIHRFRDTGDSRGLNKFTDTTVAGRRLSVDLDEIEYWAAAGETNRHRRLRWLRSRPPSSKQPTTMD